MANRMVVSILLVIGLGFRVAFVLGLPGSYNGDPNRQDSYQYDSLAWHLLTGYGFSLNRASILLFGDCPPCEPVVYPLPGYPLFLGGIYTIFGRDYLAVKLIQAAIDVASGYLAYLVARRVANSKRVAILTLGLFVVNPFTSIWATDLSTETLATFFATLTVLLAYQSARPSGRLWSLGFGLAAGLGILVRPGFLFLPVVLLSAIWLAPRLTRREVLLRCALVVALAGLCLLPWMVRNYLVFHQIVYSNLTVASEQDHVGGYYSWYLNWLQDPAWSVLANWDYVVYASAAIPDHPFPDYAYDSIAERQEVEQLMQQVKADGRFTSEVDRRFAQLARVKAERYPVRRYVIMPLVRVARLWINSGTEGFNDSSIKGSFSLERASAQPTQLGVRILLALGYSAIAPLGLFGMLLLRKRYRLLIPTALFVLYHTLVAEASGLGVRPRYVVYSLPVMILFVAVSLTAVLDKMRELRRDASQPVLDGLIEDRQ